MALHKMAQEHKLSTDTPNEIIRDQLVSSITDNKVQEKLSQEPSLMYQEMVEIYCIAESMLVQVQVVCSVGWWIPP